MRTFVLALAFVGLAWTIHVAGQTVPALPSREQLNARIAALEQQVAEANALLTNCQIPIAQPSDQSSLLIKKVTFGVTEQNRVFVRYGWVVTITNGTGDTAKRFDLELQFLDARGLVIDKKREYGQVIAAFAEQDFRGDALISLPGASNVAAVNAVVTPQR